MAGHAIEVRLAGETRNGMRGKCDGPQKKQAYHAVTDIWKMMFSGRHGVPVKDCWYSARFSCSPEGRLDARALHDGPLMPIPCQKVHGKQICSAMDCGISIEAPQITVPDRRF